MKDNRYIRNIALTVVLGLALAVCMVIRAMAPMAVLPRLDVPNVVLLSMIALLAEFYIAGEGKCNALTFLFSALLQFIGLALVYNLDKKTLAQMNQDLGRDVEADDIFVYTSAEDSDNLA